MTNFRDVIDRATYLWTDYRLDNLYQKDEGVFYLYMEGLLLNSIDMFSGCLTDLSYTEETTTQDDGETITQKAFVNTLSSKEIYILALGIAISWMEKNNLDILQINLKLNVREFKAHSEANNLKVKQETLNRMMEDYDNKITEYQLNDLTKLSYFNGGS